MKKHSKKKFTLIELLVVIAIIAILVSMLMPALGKARNMAKMITCTNNLKGIGTGMFQYFSSFDDYIPPFYSTSTGSWIKPMVDNNFLPSKLKDGVYYGVWRCPSEKKMYQTYSSYGLSAHIFKTKVTIYRKPSQVYFIADCDDPSMNPWPMSSYDSSRYRYIYRHDGPLKGIVMLQLDGHAEKKNTLIRPTTVRTEEGSVAWGIPASALTD